MTKQFVAVALSVPTIPVGNDFGRDFGSSLFRTQQCVLINRKVNMLELIKFRLSMWKISIGIFRINLHLLYLNWILLVSRVKEWSWEVKYGRHFNDVTYGELTDEDELYLWCITDQ